MTHTRLIFLSARQQPWPYLVAGEKGEIAARGVLAAGSVLAPMRTILVVPGEDVLLRWIELPACTPAQGAAAARLMLKDEIAVPPETVHLALGAPEKDGLRPVGIVARSVMQGFLDRAAAHGIVPDAVVPNHMMLSYPQDDSVHAALCEGKIVARGKRLAFCAEPELAWLLIGKHPIRAIERKEDVENLFAISAPRPAFDLLQQGFARGRSERLKSKDFRRAALLAAALLLSPLALWTAEIAAGHFAARALETRAEASARGIPGARDSADPIAYVRGRLAELEAGDRFLLTTAALFDAAGRMKSAELESLSYLREGVIRATLVHVDAAEMEILASTLEQSRIAVEQEPVTGQGAAAISLRPRP